MGRRQAVAMGESLKDRIFLIDEKDIAVHLHAGTALTTVGQYQNRAGLVLTPQQIDKFRTRTRPVNPLDVDVLVQLRPTRYQPLHQEAMFTVEDCAGIGRVLKWGVQEEQSVFQHGRLSIGRQRDHDI